MHTALLDIAAPWCLVVNSDLTVVVVGAGAGGVVVVVVVVVVAQRLDVKRCEPNKIHIYIYIIFINITSMDHMDLQTNYNL